MDDKPNAILTTPVAILLGAAIISVSILMHGGVIKVGAGVRAGAPVAQAPTQPVPEQPQAPTSATVSVDDDPVLGDPNAPITMIEFSDYECPFCKRHFDQVYPTLKKEYIDTGKVKLVFRDYPLPFHDPMATYEAQAANCARENGGDAAYFKLHDEMFNKTASNGNGLTKDQIKQMANDLGLNGNSIIACADSDKYKDEIAKDMADGSAAGVSGTPSFFIGKSDASGTIDGKILVGAQPITAFQQVLNEVLK